MVEPLESTYLGFEHFSVSPCYVVSLCVSTHTPTERFTHILYPKAALPLSPYSQYSAYSFYPIPDACSHVFLTKGNASAALEARETAQEDRPHV